MATGATVIAHPPYRYNEYKFVVRHGRLPVVLALLEAQQSDRDPFPDGTVQSVYFDTVDRRFLGQCRTGAWRKVKLRVRRYDDNDDGQLQIKFRQAHAVAKLKSDHPWQDDLEWWPDAHHGPDAGSIRAVSASFAGLQPVLDVRYRRQRFRFADYRVTLDSDIRGIVCAGLRQTAATSLRLPFAVLETKTTAPLPTLPPGLGDLVDFSSLSKYAILLRALLGEPDAYARYRPL